MQSQIKKPSALTTAISLLQEPLQTAGKDKDKMSSCIKMLQDVQTKINHIDEGNCNIMDRDINQLHAVAEFVFSSKKTVDHEASLNKEGPTKPKQFWAKATDIIAKFQKLRQENEKMKKDQLNKDTSKKMLGTAEDRIKQLQQNNNIFATECSKLRDQIKNQQYQINKLQSSLKQKDETLSKREDERTKQVDKFNTIIKNLQLDVGKLKIQMSAKQQQKSQSNKNSDASFDQKSNKQQKTKANLENQKQPSKVKPPPKDATKNLEKIQKDYESKLNQLKNIEKQLQDKTKEREEVNQMLKDINKHRKTKKNLEDQIKKCQKQHAQIQKMVLNLRKQGQQLSCNLQKAKSNYQLETSQLNKIIQHLASDNEARNEYKSFRQAIKKENIQSEEKIKSQSKTIDSLNKRIDEQVKQKSQMMVEIRATKQEAKLLQLENQLLKDQNNHLQIFVKDFHNKLQNKHKELASQNQQQGTIPFGHQAIINENQRQFLLKQLQKFYQQPISAILLFKYPLMRFCDAIQIIQNRPSLLIIVKLETQKVVALFYEESLSYSNKSVKGRALVASVSNQKTFGKKNNIEDIVVTLGKESLIFGGGEFTLRLQEDNPRLTISIGQENKNSCFETRPINAQFFTGGPDNAVVVAYEIYQLFLN